jgi:DNA-binding NarL/FixJ family response regulator
MIGKETVRTHLKSLFSKTGTRSQLQPIVKALQDSDDCGRGGEGTKR